MTRLFPAWRASLRLAVRSITRAKGRSALVALMVGAPVALAVALTTLYLTQDISPREDISARMGSAQAVATYLGDVEVKQSSDGDGYEGGGEDLSIGEVNAAARDLARLTDSSVVRVETGFVRLRSSGLEMVQADFERPAARGLLSLDSGRMPRAIGEVVVSANLARVGDLKVGGHIVDGDIDLTVVGIGDIRSARPNQDAGLIAGLPGVPNDPTTIQTEFLIDRKAPVTWDQVQALNKQGFLVESRQVILDPPSDEIYDADYSSADDTVTMIVVVSVMIEIILLAGPAFAVGVRRQRRELALIAAAGGSPRDIRRVVLAQAAVLGLGAGALGAVLGLLVSRLIVAGGVGPDFVDGFGPFDWSLPLTLLAVVLGAAAALIAAYAPARQVSREPLPVVLAGRRLEARSKAGWPAFGLVITVLGLAITFAGPALSGLDTQIAIGSILIVIGVVFMTPTLIRLIALIAPTLPLPLRLALRDTARHTSRSAPAIAAVMAAVAGIVALGIGGMSDDEENRRDYDYVRPEGRGVLFGGEDFAAAGKKVADQLPDRTLTPITADRKGATEILRADCTEGEDCMWQPGLREGEYYDEGTRVTNYRLVAADEATLEAWGVSLTAEQVRALDEGKALAPSLRGAGAVRRLQLNTYSYESEDRPTDRTLISSEVVDVVKADLTTGEVPSGKPAMLAELVVSPETAKALKLDLTTTDAVISGTISEKEQREVEKILGAPDSVFGSSSVLEVERGYDSQAPLLLLLLAGIGGAAVLIGTLSATGLALNDARPDFATLRAIGAAPGTRRVMAAAQALTIGVVGVVLGILIGTLPGVLAARSLTGQFGSSTQVVVFPWLLIGVLLILVPLVAAAVSGLFIRNNNVAVRRVAG